MARYGSSFREPPWVMGSPKEVQDWMDATHPDKEKERKEKFEKQYLKNLHIKFDFDVETKKVEPNNLFLKAIGKELIEEDFDLFETTELILRGLAKSKFKNLAELHVDDKTIYKHPEVKSDLRKNIDEIDDFKAEISKGKVIEIIAILNDIHKCKAVIKINKIHDKKKHSIDIQIKGEIKKDIYHTFINYLNEKIGFKE